MISIKNISKETVVVKRHIATNDPHCRVTGVPEPITLQPGEEIHDLGYEPGVYIKVEPLFKPEQPRSLL